MAITTTTTSLLPIRRDKQISSSVGSAIGFASSSSGGGGTAIVYSGGTGISITGTTISVIFGSTSTTVACGSHLHTGVYLPVANPIATGTLCAPIICATTCTVSPIVCSTTCLYGCDLILANIAGSTTYVSGYAGCGWKLNKNGSSYGLEVDSLKVRGALTTSQLEINTINTVNGSLMVSAANGCAYCINGTSVYFDTNNNTNPINFVVNDYICAQQFTGSGTANYLGLVTAVNQSATLGSAYVVATTVSGSPWANMKLVQAGNCVTASRQNLIYITSSDTNNPYIDMLCGVNAGTFSGKQGVRIGNLAGITDANFGALSGYGLYSQNVYLSGNIGLAGVLSFGTCKQAYGGCQQNIAMCGNCMWENSVNDEHGSIVFNWTGYNGGTTRYRDAYFGDGKQNTLLSIVGSCHLIDMFGSLNVRCCSTMNLNLCVCGCAIAMDYILASDCRLKTNIKPITVSAVNVQYKEYELCADPNKKHYGVVAQDLQEKYPELVNAGSDCMLGVNYTSLFAREIATLKCQVKDLQNDLNYYKNYNSRY